MFSIFKRQDKVFEAESFSLYRKAVDVSRFPHFYQDMGVPDTLDGRFEMICLHVSLIVIRLNGDYERTSGLSQALFDAMFADMDQSLREMGIGDMGIPRRMKHMMRSFNGRVQIYDEAIKAGDKNLSEALSRNLYGTLEKIDKAQTQQMIAYIKQVQTKLDSQSIDVLLSGKIEF